MARPTIEELRIICHPPEVMRRRNGEHWMSAIWARRSSLHVTRLIEPWPVSADQVTAAMILLGVAGAAALLIGGVGGALLAALGVQAYLLLDCVDGEVARWRGATSVRGAYLDRLGHYVVEAALLSLYGYHVGQSWRSGWVSIGLATAVLALIAKAETDLIAATGGGPIDPTDLQVVLPRRPVIRLARGVVHPLRIHRWTGAVEATLLMVAAAIVADLWWADAEKALAVSLLLISALLAIGHATSILSSGRFETADR